MSIESTRRSPATTPRVPLIVAMTPQRVFGRGGDLPWRLPDDLKRFRKLTTGHWIVMGRKTFDSIGRPLPDRTSVIITRQRDYQPAGVKIADSLEAACRLAAGEAEIFVIGGAEIYALALPRADRLLVTEVDADLPGDTFFPPWDPAAWRLVSREPHAADAKHAYPFAFCEYVRK